MSFEEVTLGDVANELTVGHVGSMASEYLESGVPFLRSLNVEPYSISKNEIRYISADFHAKLRKSALKPGDVVIVRTGKPGTCAVIPDWLEDANCSDLVIVRCGEKLDPRYLSYWVNSLASHHIGSSLVGAVQQHFNVGSARKMPLLLPSREEQSMILEAIGTLDDKIEANRRMNETLEAMARAVFRDWFVDFGPTRRQLAGASDPHAILGGLIEDAGGMAGKVDAGFPSDMPTNQELAPRLAPLFPARLADNGLPEGWEERPLSAFLEIVGGGTPKTKVPEYWSGEIPWFSVVDTPASGNVFVVDTEKSITERGLAESSARLVSAGTTIISARGTVGNLAIAAQDMTFNQSCYALQVKPPASGYFVYLAAENMVERLRSMAHGSVFSTITRSTFEGIFLPDAGTHVSEEFGGLSAPLFERIKANVIENRTLAATRDLLLPKLMSGDIRLKDAEAVI